MFVTRRLLDRQLQERSRRRRHCLKPRGRRLCNRKRTHRMAETADANRSSPLLLWMNDWNEGCLTLVYSLRLDTVPPSSAGAPPEFRPSVDPLIRWSEKKHKHSALAAVSDGTVLALVDGSTRTVVHDGATGADTAGPLLRRSKPRPIMLPVGDDTVLVMNEILRPGRHCFEALRRVPGGGGWRADAVPDPPIAYMDDDMEYDEDSIDEDIYNPGVGILAYFARGSRAWISVYKVGTLSLDMDRGAWRMEGTWELPLRDRGLFVPELGLVVGFPEGAFRHSVHKKRCWEVCALDVEARPPAVRRVWDIPPERVEELALPDTVSLAYLGNGRFCIARAIDVKVPTDDGCMCEATGTSFTLLDVRRLPGGDLDLAKHGKVQGHVWPHDGRASFLQPA